MIKVLIVGVSLCLCLEWIMSNPNGHNPKYSNIWVAKIRGGEDVARRIAKDIGYTYKGQCGQLPDYYELVKDDLPEVSTRESSHLTNSILDLDEVVWAKQQQLVRRMNYGLLWKNNEEAQEKTLMTYLKSEAQRQIQDVGSSFKSKREFSIFNNDHSVFSFFSSKPNQGDISKLGTFPTTPAPNSQLQFYSSVTTKPIGLISKKVSAYASKYNDPFWKKQWNLQDYRTVDMPVMDLNVVPVHKMGYTGKGVIVSVVDDGVDETNYEFKNNFIRRLSYDTCKDIPGSKPGKTHHGTNCAGIIAMQPDNKKCGVGIAFNAQIVGIRAICEKEQTEATTSKGLVHAVEDIDISSNSWGLVGFGELFFERDHLTDEAYYTGITKGRKGKGVIYVRAAGNEKSMGDHCGVDPEVNSPYVIPIAGADQRGLAADYSERCTAIFATTYTHSGSLEGIVAPNIGKGCTTKFGGTSAACPQASAIIALVLEANPDLTYRDVMHLIAMSSEVAPLASNKDTWYKNGRGFWVSNDFGFGLMNAENMVNLAKSWKNVPERRECIVSVKLDEPMSFSKVQEARIPFETSGCQESSTDEINYLEHIELASIAEYMFRGDIMIFVQSPAGTTSQLLEVRHKDISQEGLHGWSIVSTHNWGEQPQGTWTVIYKVKKSSRTETSGLVREFTMKFYGTKTKPAHYRERRTYAAFRLPDGKTS